MTNSHSYFDWFFDYEQETTLTPGALGPEDESITTIDTIFTDLVHNVTHLEGNETNSDWITSTQTTFAPYISCAKEELAEPEFQRRACEGSPITAWIAASFLLSMVIFGVIKCLTAHGLRSIFDVRTKGVSFPKRPEFFALLGSSLPLVFTVLTRPLFEPLSLGHDIFIRGWGLAQTRFFFDLFTRTATIYHLIYWAYRTPLINAIWYFKLFRDDCQERWENRQLQQIKAAETRRSLFGLFQQSKNKQSEKPARRTVRTSEYGYGTKKQRARSKSVRTGARGQEKGSSAANGSNDPQSGQQSQQHELLQLQTQVVSAGGVSIIAPQRLFPSNPANTMVNPYMSGMFSTMNGSPFGNDMSFYGPGMGAQNQLVSFALTDANPNSNTDTEIGAAKAKVVTKKPKPPPTELFSRTCKRIIPGLIYLLSFSATIPSILAFEVEPDEEAFVAARCTSMCSSYFYYELVILVIVPTCLIIIAFFHGALAQKQMNRESKMTYRLRCYYITFILLNIPMLVLMLTSLAFEPKTVQYQSIYATGILIAMTAYHANFALKSTVYTTACNCICCPDVCLNRIPLLDRCITYFTTPVAFKDKEAQMEGIVIPVFVDNAPTEKKK